LGTLDTFAISWLLTGRVDIAGSIAGLEIVTKIAWYYLHERVWAAIPWGRRPLRRPPSGRSASPADAPQALAEPFVFAADLVERLRLFVVNGVRLPLRGEFLGLTIVTGFAINFRIDEPALLHSRRGRGTDDDGKQNAGKETHGRSMEIGNRRWRSSFKERHEIFNHEVAGHVHDRTDDQQCECEPHPQRS
jgi:uncharacterized membrane protein